MDLGLPIDKAVGVPNTRRMTKPKPKKNPEAVRVIDAFGGTGKVAKLCGIEPASVSGWKTTRIPPAREQYLRLLNPAAFHQQER